MSADKQQTARPKRTRGRPKLEDVADIENKLLAVAMQEFLQHGYGGASVSRIVRRAGVSKTTVYSRFESKEALFHAIVEQQIDRLSPAEQLISETGHLSLEEGLRKFADRMLALSLEGEMLGLNRLMYSESHRFPELGLAVANRTTMGIKRISTFISECAADEGRSCRDPDAVAEVFILSIRGWYINAMLTNSKVTAEQRRDWVDRLIHVLMSSDSHW